MNEIITCIEKLRLKLEKFRKAHLKELPTRITFIDPVLRALGWDVEDPDEVAVEYQTRDGKSVDYALKINQKVVLFMEAKPLNDPLDDEKAIGQVVSYGAVAGVDWCVLTNGVTYKVYRSTEKAAAPDKLLYEVSLDPKESEDITIEQVADRLRRFSREAMEKGLLDEIGEEIFTTGKVRKALDNLLTDPPAYLVTLIRKATGGEAIKPVQIRNALKRLWSQTAQTGPTGKVKPRPDSRQEDNGKRKREEYSESHHTEGRPQEVVELYRAVDKFCMQLEPGAVQRKCTKWYIGYVLKRVFCSLRLSKSQVLVWVRLSYTDLQMPPSFVRDVSSVGHWGLGDVELRIDSLDVFQDAKAYIQRAFEENR
ncbi:MAG TPA: DUF5655 domain-containing protein [bacterium]|nr:DUF5655 domain-containing protein [bacterium]